MKAFKHLCLAAWVAIAVPPQEANGQFNNYFSGSPAFLQERGQAGITDFNGEVQFLWNQEVSSGNYNMRLTRLDPVTGQVINFPVPTRTYNTATGAEEGLDLIQLPDSGFVIVGYTTDVLSGFGGEDAIVMRIDKFGNLIWNYRFGTSGQDRAVGVTQAANSDILVTGNLDNGSFGLPNQDIWVARLAVIDGSPIWSNLYPGPFNDYGIQVKEGTPFGSTDIYVGGNTITFGPNPGTDQNIFIMALDQFGNMNTMSVVDRTPISAGPVYESFKNFVFTGGPGFLIGGSTIDALGNQDALAVELNVGMNPVYYDAIDLAFSFEDCWVYERGPSDYIAMGNYLDITMFGAVFYRWTQPFTPATLGPITPNIFQGGKAGSMYGYTKAPTVGNGFCLFGDGDQVMGTNPDVWTIGTDFNGQAVAACNLTTPGNVTQYFPPPFLTSPPALPFGPVDTLFIANGDTILDDTVNCTVTTPVSGCLAATDPLYVKFFADPAYTTSTVWPAKVYVDDGVIITVTGPGVTLDITNTDVVFGVGAGIRFQSGACIRGNNSVFRPCEKDSTWLGVEFRDSSNGIVDECIFKNAFVALEMTDSSQVKIVNNAFINNRIGVSVTGLLGFNRQYSQGITGNTVMVDDDRPDYGLGQNFIGVRVRNTHMLNLISHNDFIYTKQRPTNITELTGIALRSSDATVSENKFTNCFHAVFSSGLPWTLGLTTIENNEIEYNDLSFTLGTEAIHVNSFQNVIIEGNEINSIQSAAHVPAQPLIGIYTFDGFNLTVIDNEIKGFYTGMYFDRSNYSVITENLVEDCDSFGIIALNDVDGLYITENKIRLDGEGTGILFWHDASFSPPTGFNKIESNCIFDTDTAIATLNQSVVVKTIPTIRDNYMYSYFDCGVSNHSFSGAIGTGTNCNIAPSSPAYPHDSTLGRNSFISNEETPAPNLAAYTVDIFSNINLTFAGNFTGADNVANTASFQWQSPGYVWVAAGAQTITVSAFNRFCQRNSRANCGQQIGNKTAETGFESFYKMVEATSPLDWDGVYFNLRSDWRASLDALNATDCFDKLSAMTSLLFEYGWPDDAGLLFSYAEAHSALSANQKLWLEFLHHSFRGELSAAVAVLENIVPESETEAGVLVLAHIGVQNPAVLSAEQRASLLAMDVKGHLLRHAARFVLNEYEGGYPAVFPDFPEGGGSPMTPVRVHVGGTDTLSISPNPGQGDMELWWNLQSEGKSSVIIYNIWGQEVRHMELNEASGQTKVSLAGEPEGIYIVVLKSSDGTTMTRKYVLN